MDVRCSQCSASVTVPPDARLLRCSFCEAALVVDPSGVLFNEVMVPTVERHQVPAHLRRFFASDYTVSGLDREAQIGEPRLEYFPFWGFTIRADPGERTTLMPAAPSALQGLQGLTVPAGETKPMSPRITGDTKVLDPEVPLATAQGWLKTRFGDVKVARSILYHLPLFRVAYTYRGRTYQAAVDAVSGRVFPSIFPAKAETPYLLVFTLALAVFAIEGFAVRNLAVKAALYAVSALPILALSWWVIRKQ